MRQLPIDSTPAALDAVRDGVADYACVPIENSIDGSVMPTLDSLAIGSPLQVFAEMTLDVAFSIVVKPGRSCRRRTHAGGLPGGRGTGAAVARRPSARRRTAAGVLQRRRGAAGRRRPGRRRGDLTAGRHPLGSGALAEGVVDEANARTRFVLVGPPGPPPARTGADRTSVVLRIDNAPGALVAALAEFGIRGIDLTRIESRPTRTELGTYLFFVDCVGHIDDDAVAEALKALHRRCADVRYLGSWPTGPAAGVGPPPPDEASRWLAGLRDGKPEQAQRTSGRTKP